MSPERWQQISRIFKSAISLDDEARAAYVSSACGSDTSLRAEVDKLIASHKQAGEQDFIGGMAADDAAALLVNKGSGEAHTPRLVKDQQLGSYHILDLLGAGGMGEVYLAKDSRLDRTVALKVLSPDVSSDKRRMLRFRQEAKVASSLNQPNILTIYESGEVDGLTFLATEYIDGTTLRDYLRRKRLKLGEILDITIQVLAALDAAHEANIIHRDIKPENVMIRRRDRVVKVLDFGLAKVTEKRSLASDLKSDLEAATEFKTAPGVLMGTINYMSPEQAQGREVDVRTDIWSTGVVLYEMVAGTQPFKGPTTSHTIVQILEKDPPPLTQVSDVPDELQRIVGKTMAKDPDERYQTAKDLVIDLRSLKKQLDLRAEIDRTSSTETQPTARVMPAVTRRSDKKRASVIAVVAIVFALAGVFAVKTWRASRTGANAPAVAPAAAPAPEARTLTYWITVQKFRDGRAYQNPFTVAGEMIFEADYQIRVHVRSPQAGHLYVFNEGPAEAGAAPEFVIVFPTQTANKGSSLLQAGAVVQIPEQTWLRFDSARGVEKLWLVFAADPVAELEALQQFAIPKTRNLITDLDENKALKNFLTARSSQKAAAEKGETLTTLKSPDKLLVHEIRLEHQ